MIETRFAAAPACGHCGASDFKPWGSASGLKRYMCKACERTFNALTGMPLAFMVDATLIFEPGESNTAQVDNHRVTAMVVFDL